MPRSSPTPSSTMLYETPRQGSPRSRRPIRAAPGPRARSRGRRHSWDPLRAWRETPARARPRSVDPKELVRDRRSLAGLGGGRGLCVAAEVERAEQDDRQAGRGEPVHPDQRLGKAVEREMEVRREARVELEHRVRRGREADVEADHAVRRGERPDGTL